MAIYLTSDLHGDLMHFLKLLNLIKFDTDKDFMYVLGDVLDRGNENLKLLDHVREYIDAGNMLLIKGNHELFAQMYLQGRLDPRQWILWGGRQTLTEISQLSLAQREELKTFLCGLPFYQIISTTDKTLLLTHSGLDADYLVESDNKLDVEESIKTAVANDEFKYLVSNDIHYMPWGQIMKMDYYVVVGHVPAMRLNEDASCNIVHTEKYMCIDTGAGFRDSGGKMSCYRLDDGREFYV